MGCVKSKIDDGGTDRARPSSASNGKKEKKSKKKSSEEVTSEGSQKYSRPAGTSATTNKQPNISVVVTPHNYSEQLPGSSNTRIAWQQQDGSPQTSTSTPHQKYSTQNESNWAQSVDTFHVEATKIPNRNMSNIGGFKQAVRHPNTNECCLLLWENDDRPDRNRDYKISPKTGGEFVYNVAKRITQRLTFSMLDILFDALDQNTEANKMAEIAFVKIVMETQVMQLCHQLLCQRIKQFYLHDQQQFLTEVQKIWFSKKTGHSAFHHIFAGFNNSGLHNWFRFYRLARAGQISLISCRTERYIASVTFDSAEMDDEKTSSMFIGTTPEFEIALYTFLYFITMTTRDKNVYNKQKSKYSFKPDDENKEISVAIVTNGNLLITAYPLIQEYD